ncbi:hypothetical protein BKA65DRAFT_485306 [Rhexocercosporidium sp. MPI-PUGE-AT-0058]|nr:hypothetical protein BKA65DRAFT_485306 [Rhexocercosporidium sp. MPI-PUGE-AT-0058]
MAIDEKHHASAKSNYFDWQEIQERDKLYRVFIVSENEDISTNDLAFHQGPEKAIYNLRGKEDDSSLNTSGFAFRQHTTCVKDFSRGRRLKRGTQLRDTSYVAKGTTIDLNNPMELLKPAAHVFIGTVNSQISSVESRVRQKLPERADELLQGRVRIVNIWRPIRGPVLNHNLALCDGRTLVDPGRVEADHIRRQYSGSTFYMKYSEKYRLHHLHAHQPDEVTLIKCFDSDTAVEALWAPHASFSLDSPGLRDESRASIEIRALIFTDAGSRDTGSLLKHHPRSLNTIISLSDYGLGILIRESSYFSDSISFF